MKRALITFAILSAAFGLSAQSSRSLDVEPLRKFSEFYQYLNGTYIDTVGNKRLVDKAIESVLSELDPHSAYIPAEEMKAVSESIEGSFSGIGIEFNVLKDTIIVVNTIVGGPSERVGLLPKDRIIEVNGESVIGFKQNQVPKVLRGPKGTVANLKVIRHGDKEPLSFRIVRDNIPINTIDAAYKLNDKTGYIKVNRFAHTTMSEFDEAFAKMKDIDALVLDLRGNGGGILEQAVAMANFFLPKGAVIVSTEGRAMQPMVINASYEGKFTKGKVVVLIDESSASASEIVSGALQDWDRAVIIGRRSFGKGLVQRQFPFDDGSAVRITVSRYLTPSGRAIQRPFEMGKKDEYYTSRYKNMATGADSLHTTDTLKYKTLRKGRTVYGGGGIYPDIYIAVDTTGYTPYWAKLVRAGVINEFVVTYTDDNRDKLKAAYPSFDKFRKDFAVDNSIIDGLVALGVKREVAADSAAMEISKPYISNQIKALLAQKLWTTNEYFIISNSFRDAEMKKAQEAIDNWAKFSGGI